MKQKKVFLLAGVPASGKSTWARNHMTPTTEWISRDNVRFSIVREDEEYFSHEEEVFDTFIAYINQTLENPDIHTIYVDATHLNRAARDKVLRRLNLDLLDETICVFFNIDEQNIPIDYLCIYRVSISYSAEYKPQDTYVCCLNARGLNTRALNRSFPVLL
jgi:hypothetical protein